MTLDKPEIRQSIRSRRKKLIPELIKEAAIQVTAHVGVWTPFQDAQNIGVYSANERELDPIFIIQTAQSQGKQCYLPVISKDDKNDMKFYAFDDASTLTENRFGVKEPDIHSAASYAAEKLDLIFVPLVCFDAQCHRIGRGVGFYDRFLEFALKTSREKRPLLVGLAYEFQKIENTEPCEWDVPMDFVFTEEKLYCK